MPALTPAQRLNNGNGGSTPAASAPSSTDPSGGALPEYGGNTLSPGTTNSQYGSMISQIANGTYSGNPQNLVQAPSIPGVATPQRNPQQSALAGQQLQQSQDYLANMQANSDSLYGTAAATARTQLAGTIRGTRNSYNSRGLLSSGAETSAEEGATADTQNQLASTRASINSGLLSTQAGMEGNAFNSYANLAQPGAQIAGTYLSGVGSNIGQQTQNTQIANAAYGNIGQGLGAAGAAGLAGAIYGQGAPTTPNPLSTAIGGYNPLPAYNGVGVPGSLSQLIGNYNAMPNYANVGGQ